jgi:transposase
MTQAERDRLVVLRKAEAKSITQKQEAEELGVTERQVRRLVAKLREQGDRAVVHGLGGRASSRRLSEEKRAKAVAVLSQQRC